MRYTWGSPDGKPVGYHITVSEDTGNAGAFKRGEPSSPYPLYQADGVTPLTDFLLWNPVDSAYNIGASSLTTDANGYPPAFQGPDGVTWVYGRDEPTEGVVTIIGIRASDAGGTGTGGVSSYNDLTDVPSTFPPAAHNQAISTITGLQAALDAKAASVHTHDDRYYTETEIDDKLSNIGVGGPYRPALRVYESGGVIPTRATVTTDPAQPVEVVLALGSTINPYDASYGYVAGFDTVGKTVPA